MHAIASRISKDGDENVIVVMAFIRREHNALYLGTGWELRNMAAGLTSFVEVLNTVKARDDTNQLLVLFVETHAFKTGLADEHGT